LGWIKEEPATGGVRLRDRWANASIFLNNSFAISNMERHNMMKGQIEKGKLNNDRFLKRIKSSAAIQFSYFNRFMVGLEEDVSEVRLREQMEEYLGNFLKVVDNI
jgi:hypothetical protein